MSDHTEDFPATPTLQRMSDVHDQAITIGTFLEWGQENGLIMCRLDKQSERYYSAESINDLLHLYFQIDGKKEEQERQAILKYIRQESP